MTTGEIESSEDEELIPVQRDVITEDDDQGSNDADESNDSDDDPGSHP